MDFANILKTALPWIGAAATGNIPALVGMAAKTISDVTGVDVAADAESIAKAYQGATPEQKLALQAQDYDFKLKWEAMANSHAETMQTLGLDETRVYVTDTADARKANSGNDAVFKLGIAIIITFGLLMGAVLWGCYLLATGVKVVDNSLLAIVGSLIGTVVGYVAANAQQVVSYFFGSSKSSTTNGNAVREALTSSLDKIAATKSTPQ